MTVTDGSSVSTETYFVRVRRPAVPAMLRIPKTVRLVGTACPQTKRSNENISESQAGSKLMYVDVLGVHMISRREALLGGVLALSGCTVRREGSRTVNPSLEETPRATPADNGDFGTQSPTVEEGTPHPTITTDNGIRGRIAENTDPQIRAEWLNVGPHMGRYRVRVRLHNQGETGKGNFPTVCRFYAPDELLYTDSNRTTVEEGDWANCAHYLFDEAGIDRLDNFELFLGVRK